MRKFITRDTCSHDLSTSEKKHLNLLNIRYYEIIRHNNAVITMKVEMKFRGYVFEWPRATQATPQSGWKNPIFQGENIQLTKQISTK